MNHFQIDTGILTKRQLPPKPASVMAPTTALSQAELRDIVLAVLG